ncbi:SMI1/KNR4 family protein [Deinococcus altitudinis]|uniref:SMI1/KNR4 family protein n=1 Tax=Deinococcus altitudinis TaxID=468914 RepID=UPI0038913B37
MNIPADFWEADPHGYQAKNYIEPPPTPEMIASVEAELGYTLPASYVQLMRTQNGGCPANTCHATSEATSWAEDHVAITGLSGIGREKTYGLCGELGSQFMIDEWGYPPLGIYFADCPSAGHDMVALDYRECGPQGEPCVVHVDQEGDYEVTWLAPDFATFIAQLQPEEAFQDDPAEVKAEELTLVQQAPFGPLLQTLCNAYPNPDLATGLRELAAAIVKKKGSFGLHGDELSSLMYDLQFLLCSHSRPVPSRETYLADDAYPSIIALSGGRFSTGGYAPGFVEDWWDEARRQGRIVETGEGLRFTPDAAQEVLDNVLGTVLEQGEG